MITKYNIPITTEGGIPNANNLSDEIKTIESLALKTTRSNVGQLSYTSPTSGVTYNTASYSSNPNIYNKGETGLYNLLLQELDEYILQAKDLNTYGEGTLTATSWTGATGDYAYSKNFPISGVTSQHIVNVILDRNVADIALVAELCPTNESYNGGITFYAKKVPTGSITFNYIIFK